jgi:hypothetical protein
MTLLVMQDRLTSELLNARLVTFSPFGHSRSLPFTIADISKEAITFRKQNGKEQTARRSEIEFVCQNWQKAKEGSITRRELQKKSFNTSYLFGLFHFIESHLN